MKFKKYIINLSSRSLIGYSKNIDIKTFKIPEDIYPLEFSSISKIDNHKDLEYLYILYDNLDEYEDDDEIKMFYNFFVKIDDQLIETNREITNYTIDVSTRVKLYD